MAALSSVWQRLLLPVAGGARAARSLLAPAGARGLADNAKKAAPAPAPQPAPATHSSIMPPVPGQGSHLRWNGKKYEDIPILHILATYNNTHVTITNKNVRLVHATCGSEGFRDAKKGTSVAAHAAGLAAAVKACRKGVSHVRLILKGLGPGRLAAIQGVIMGGLEIISITDNTPVPHNGCRPRKARKV